MRTNLPLDPYLLEPAEANDLDVVVDRLTTACMRRFDPTWPGDARNVAKADAPPGDHRSPAPGGEKPLPPGTGAPNMHGRDTRAESEKPLCRATRAPNTHGRDTRAEPRARSRRTPWSPSPPGRRQATPSGNPSTERARSDTRAESDV
ncbi:hypothetical protein [Paractinoplanes brasiliensis]|uniref:hypothetical protein n=1 Tax=Paractinoplanes brasiliensis TaxID=52695 RepID=UPI00105C3E6B|nr:hypothetical protein [Actinoplanes brasiliensis]GID27984.1 hypothetical protein Abr02nite_29670 [Actinoplanes brasiliensis]